MSERFGATAQNTNTAESFVYSDPGEFVDQYSQNQLRPAPSLSLEDIAEILDAKDSPLEIVKHTTNSKERDRTLADLNDPVPNDFAPDSIFAHAKNAAKDRNSRDYKNKAILTVRLTRGDSKRAFARTVYKVNDDITKLGFSGGTPFKNVYRTMARIEDSSTGILKHEYYAEMPKDDPRTRSALQAGGKYIAPGHQMLAKITPDFVREINEFQAELKIKEIREEASRYGLDVSPAVDKQILAAEQSVAPVTQVTSAVQSEATVTDIDTTTKLYDPASGSGGFDDFKLPAASPTSANYEEDSKASSELDEALRQPEAAERAQAEGERGEPMTDEIPVSEYEDVPKKETSAARAGIVKVAATPEQEGNSLEEEPKTKDDDKDVSSRKIGRVVVEKVIGGAINLSNDFRKHPVGIGLAVLGLFVVSGGAIGFGPKVMESMEEKEQLIGSVEAAATDIGIEGVEGFMQVRVSTPEGMVESPIIEQMADELSEKTGKEVDVNNFNNSWVAYYEGKAEEAKDADEKKRNEELAKNVPDSFSIPKATIELSYSVDGRGFIRSVTDDKSQVEVNLDKLTVELDTDTTGDNSILLTKFPEGLAIGEPEVNEESRVNHNKLITDLDSKEELADQASRLAEPGVSKVFAGLDSGSKPEDREMVDGAVQAEIQKAINSQPGYESSKVIFTGSPELVLSEDDASISAGEKDVIAGVGSISILENPTVTTKEKEEKEGDN